MFEPRAYCECSLEQQHLLAALLSRDLPKFCALLESPDVDPNYWYGKPHWTTCLSLACKLEGCESFVLALLRAGASVSKLTKVHSIDDRTHNEGTRHLVTQEIQKLNSGMENVKLQNEKILHEQQILETKQTNLKDHVEQVMEGTREHLQKNEAYFDEFRQKLNKFESLLTRIEETENQNSILLGQILGNLKSKSND